MGLRHATAVPSVDDQADFRYVQIVHAIDLAVEAILTGSRAWGAFAAR